MDVVGCGWLRRFAFHRLRTPNGWKREVDKWLTAAAINGGNVPPRRGIRKDIGDDGMAGKVVSKMVKKGATRMEPHDSRRILALPCFRRRIGADAFL
jgi:hypothetical protein